TATRMWQRGLSHGPSPATSPVVPVNSTGTSGTFALMANSNAPRLNGNSSPPAAYVPSGKRSTGIPRESHARQSSITCPIDLARPRTPLTYRANRILQPTSGSENSDALETNLNCARRNMQATMSAIDWWLATNTHAPAGSFSLPSTSTFQPGHIRRYIGVQ